MNTVVGTFANWESAERAAAALELLGIPRDRLTILTPGDAGRTLSKVPTTESEPPGVGPALGGVIGGAAGAAGGIQAGVLTSILVPGVGPVVVLGLLGAALLGVTGAKVGQALDESLREGLPKDEIFVYEDALRQGRTVVIALVDDAQQVEAARQILTAAGAESLDAAREAWWIGLRDAEAAHYEARGGQFSRDEEEYRCGFEAALSLGRDGRSYGDVLGQLRAVYPDVCEGEAFRCGYARGQIYADRQRQRDRAA